MADSYNLLTEAWTGTLHCMIFHAYNRLIENGTIYATAKRR